MLEEIKSLQHPLVKHLVRLRKDKIYRQESKTCLLEGKKVLFEVCVGTQAHVVFCAEESSLDFSRLKAKKSFRVPYALIQKISGTEHPEEILAEVPLPLPTNLAQAGKILVLEAINDPGNLGTLIRTALALDWEGVWFLPDCVDPFNAKALRASRGALFSLPYHRGPLEELQKFMLERGLKLLIADGRGESVNTIKPLKHCLLALANEAHGPSSELLALGKTIAIPMHPFVESLNVAVAGAILMHRLGSCKDLEKGAQSSLQTRDYAKIF